MITVDGENRQISLAACTRISNVHYPNFIVNNLVFLRNIYFISRIYTVAYDFPYRNNPFICVRTILRNRLCAASDYYYSDGFRIRSFRNSRGGRISEQSVTRVIIPFFFFSFRFGRHLEWISKRTAPTR